MKPLLEYAFDTYPRSNPPGVHTHCMFGYGIPTLNVVVYKDYNLATAPVDIIEVDGDSTVTTNSLESVRGRLLLCSHSPQAICTLSVPCFSHACRSCVRF